MKLGKKLVLEEGVDSLTLATLIGRQADNLTMPKPTCIFLFSQYSQSFPDLIGEMTCYQALLKKVYSLAASVSYFTWHLGTKIKEIRRFFSIKKLKCYFLY